MMSPSPEVPSVGDVLVRADTVTVVRDGRAIVDAVNVEVRAGELVAMVGPNGAGKTTLLSALAGDLVPDRGEVQVAGRPVAQWSVRDLARQRAVLPQQVTVTFPFTVSDVVRMGRAPWARTPAMVDDDAIVVAELVRCDVHHLAHRRVPSLSGGERARVALARVLAQRTPLLLLDEPTASLDVGHQELVLTLARERAVAGDAVAVVLHDLSSAAAYADRIVVMSDGRAVADGAPSEVLDPGLLSAIYRHEIDVVEHPDHTGLLVVPRRRSCAVRP